MSKLTIVRGLPGSGKSTFAKSMNTFHIENDFFSMKDGVYSFSKQNKEVGIQKTKEIVRIVLVTGSDCVVSNVFTSRGDIEDLIEIATECGASHEVIRLESDYGNIHDVPDDVMIELKLKFEDYPDETIIN